MRRVGAKSPRGRSHKTDQKRRFKTMSPNVQAPHPAVQHDWQKRIVESESEHTGNRSTARLSTMKKAKEYLQYERECRELAAKPSNSEHKNALLEMAATWSHIAADRKAGMLREHHHKLRHHQR